MRGGEKSKGKENKKKLSVKSHVQQLRYTNTGFRIHQRAGLSRSKSEKDEDGGMEGGNMKRGLRKGKKREQRPRGCNPM